MVKLLENKNWLTMRNRISWIGLRVSKCVSGWLYELFGLDYGIKNEVIRFH